MVSTQTRRPFANSSDGDASRRVRGQEIRGRTYEPEG